MIEARKGWNHDTIAMIKSWNGMIEPQFLTSRESTKSRRYSLVQPVEYRRYPPGSDHVSGAINSAQNPKIGR